MVEKFTPPPDAPPGSQDAKVDKIISTDRE
jgi:hypothetical protein